MKKMKYKIAFIAVGCVAGWLFATGKFKNIISTVSNLVKGNNSAGEDEAV